MKVYDNKHWISVLLSMHKADTFKTLASGMITMAMYAGVIVYLETEYFKVDKDSAFRNISLIHTLLGFVLSMLLVFRTNTAYDRWWEGRKLLGKMVNDSRNLAIKLHAILPENAEEDRAFFQKYICFFPHLLSRHLSKKSTKMELDQDSQHTEVEQLPHPPNALVWRLQERVLKLYKDGVIVAEQMRMLDAHISGLLDVCGGCERIKNTPIPFSYSSFTKKFIVVYVTTLPIAYGMNIGYLMVILTVFVFYVLMSLEVLAEEIEEPFNNEENDLPMEAIAQNIERNVIRIFSES
ncbi:MAG: bestrophin family protein [Flavobacteriaceae bacterium]|nr:bestrophin family protein [Flavobacteriaceae bacterium]